MKQALGIISMFDVKAKFPTDEKIFNFQIEVWLKIVGQYSLDDFTNAVHDHYKFTPWQPGPVDIEKIIIKNRGKELQKIRIAEEKRKEIEYQRGLAEDKIALIELQSRPDYQKLRQDFISKYNEKYPTVDVMDEKTVSVDANILVYLKFGFYHFEHEDRGLIDEGHCNFVQATPEQIEGRKMLMIEAAQSPKPRTLSEYFAPKEDVAGETSEEKAARKVKEAIEEWKNTEIRKRLAEPDSKAVRVVNEVAAEAEAKFGKYFKPSTFRVIEREEKIA